jgi:nucleoside-diphosphate-sugar epimerase
MKRPPLRDLLSPQSNSIKETMKIIDLNALGVAFIINEANKLAGVATDGDIRRAILKGKSLETPIKDVMNPNPFTLKEDSIDLELVRSLDPEHIKIIPLIDTDNFIKDYLYSTEISGQKLIKQDKNIGVKRVLIIGGAGYIGSVLSRKLLDRGYKVKILDMLLFGDNSIRELYGNSNFELIKGDIRNIQTVVNAIKNTDAVIHLGAIVGDPACALNAEETVEINYLAAKMIAEICKYHQINRFLFASTCSVYGASPSILTEESSVNPVSLYAETKLKTEQGILSLVDNNFSPCVLRLATVNGASPRMRFDLVVNTFIAKAIKEGKISIFGGSQWRPNVHVQDVADAFITCIEAPIVKIKGEIFNVGSNEQNYQIYQLGELIKKELIKKNIGVEIEVLKENPDRRDYHVSFDKINNILNFRAQKRIEDAVEEIKQLFENDAIPNHQDAIYNNYLIMKDQQVVGKNERD